MFKSSLRRDVVLVVLAKVAILMIIKNVWFDAPSIPENGSVRVADHLLDSRGSIPEGGPRWSRKALSIYHACSSP
ncbi:cytochrome oxidase putative small subunit CydP [Stutzerimonas kunmingensis]|nr:cytochrome oxidase putative small subunit CydP [Stutzerimonas kunmingensis]